MNGEISDLQQFRAEWARDSYIKFVEYVFEYIYRKQFNRNWHHDYLSEVFMEVNRGNLRRFIINIPPRYSKSEFATVCYDAWAKGRDPQFSFVSASYSEALALDHSEMTRNIMLDPAYQVVFPHVEISKGKKDKANWATNHGGRRIATGVGGTLTGRGGFGLLIDDPHKPLDMENSESSRLKDISWFNTTLYSRLDDKKNGFIGVIMQRLHDQDLTGYLLEKGDESGLHYEHILVPMETGKITYSIGNFKYERVEGELIWPHFEGPEELVETKSALDTHYAAQYNQEPIDETKLVFKREKFYEHPFDYYNPPKDLEKYAISDFALSENRGDYTVHSIWAVDQDGYLLPLEVWREQVESTEWAEAMFSMYTQHQVGMWWAEHGQIEKSVGPFLRRMMQDSGIYIPIETVKPIGNKFMRAQSYRARHNQGMVRYPTNAPWFEEFKNELIRFPRGKNDDQVDVCSYIGLVLDLTDMALVPRGPVKKSWRTRLKKVYNGQGSSANASWLRA